MLQLHALTDNPMTYTIMGNLTIDAEVKVGVPSGKIGISTKTVRPKITILDGVTVVKVTNSWLGETYYVGVTAGRTYTFESCYTYAEGDYSYYSAALQETYRSVNWYPAAEYPNWETWDYIDVDSTFYIEYSPVINAVRPSITDY